MTTKLYCENVKFEFLDDEQKEYAEYNDIHISEKIKYKLIAIIASSIHDHIMMSCLYEDTTWIQFKDSILSLINENIIKDEDKIIDIQFNTSGFINFDIDICRLIDTRYKNLYDVLEHDAIIYIAMIKRKNTNWKPILQSLICSSVK